MESFIAELDAKVSELLTDKELLLEAIDNGIGVMQDLRDQLEG